MCAVGGCRLLLVCSCADTPPPLTASTAPATNRFDTIFVNERIRIAQDIRGDTLIVERDGPPRIFT